MVQSLERSLSEWVELLGKILACRGLPTYRALALITAGLRKGYKRCFWWLRPVMVTGQLGVGVAGIRYQRSERTA
jgi:hypothetical protein